jgi:hypothetical protein
MMTMTTHAERVDLPATVTEVSLPADARALSTLSRIDYEDAFRVDATVKRTPEQWARAVLQDAPLAVRARLTSGWTTLGLKLGPPWSAHRVLGWEVQHSDPDFALLKAGSRLGLQGELLFRREPHGLLFATFVALSNPAARAAWAGIEHQHRRVVHSLLDHAARREAQRGAS